VSVVLATGTAARILFFNLFAHADVQDKDIEGKGGEGGGVGGKSSTGKAAKRLLVRPWACGFA